MIRALSSGPPFSRSPVRAIAVTPAVMSVGGASTEKSLFLLSRSVGGEGSTAQRDVGLHGDADRGVGAGDLLQHQVVGDEVATRSAVLLRQRQAHQAEAGHLSDDVVGELLLAVELGGTRPDLTLSIIVGEVSPPLLFVGQVEIHSLYPPVP